MVVISNVSIIDINIEDSNIVGVELYKYTPSIIIRDGKVVQGVELDLSCSVYLRLKMLRYWNGFFSFESE